MTVETLPGGVGPLLGWCEACYGGSGRFVPAVDAGLRVCRAHLRLLPRRPAIAGQLLLDVDAAVVPPALRAPYPTGEQRQCTDCAAAGVPWPRQGLSGRMPGDAMPLCLPCWRSRTERARRGERRLSPDETGWLVELAEQLACEACGPKAPPAVREDLLPPAAAAAKRRRRRLEKARMRQRPRSRPRPRRRTGCWRCADASWVVSLRAVHEADQQAAAADVVRVDGLQAAHAAAVRAVERARRRLQTVLVWRERVGSVVEAIPRLVKTGSRGRLQLKTGAGSRARAWALTANYLALADADRQERGLSARGRPSQLPHVVAVMAVAASYESGRGSMVGLDWTAMFAGVSPRTVTTGWASTVGLGATKRVKRGRILTIDERRELKRHRQRAVYNFTPLHRSPVDLRPYRGAAAEVLAQLFARAVRLVDEHQGLVDQLVAEAAAVEAELLDARAWAAEQTSRELASRAAVDPLWVEDAAQAVQVADVARARASRAACPPVDTAAWIAAQRAGRDARQAAARAVDNAFEQARRMTIFCDHPRRGQGEQFISGYQFWGKTSAQPTSPVAGGQRPGGRGEGQRLNGASRSPTKSAARLTGPGRPRTILRVRPGSPARPSRSAVMRWAKPLARALAKQWEFLGRYLGEASDVRGGALAVARERGLRVRKIADTLGSRLDEDWSADQVVRLVERFAGVHSVIAPGDAHSPLRYLAAMLDRALTNPAAVIPHHSPVREAYERDVLAADLAAEAARSDAIAADLAERDAAAAAERAGDQTGRLAARAAAAGARRTRPGDPDNAEKMAEAHADLAQRQHRVAPHGAYEPAAWPQPRHAGAGLPDGWRHGDA